MVKLQDVLPENIESESFRIIEDEFFDQTGKQIADIDPGEFKVLQRVIHATGDFSISDNLLFQYDPIQRALANIKSGCNILTDVNMVASGISKPLLKKYGGEVVCKIADTTTADMARAEGITRSEASMRQAVTDNIGVIAIGNAPTALISAIRLRKEGHFKDAAIVGVPVGFVNAAESKEMLIQTDIPAITLSGRRGGSPIAAAIVNAILRLA